MNTELIHIIFDFDGTLWNSTKSVRRSLKKALLINDFIHLSENLPDFEIGLPMENILENDFKFDSENALKIAKTFREIFKSEDLDTGFFYDGVIETIEYLRKENIKISIATYKKSTLLKEILIKYEVFNLFDSLFALEDNETLEDKNKSMLVNECISQYEEYKTFLVGDTKSDFNAAIDNEINFFLVEYGYGFNSINQDSIYDKHHKVIIRSLHDIKKYLKIE